MTSQAGGKGVNISRAAVSAGIPSIAVVPAGQGRPVRHRAARRRHRLPSGPTRRRRPRQPHDHRAGRHHHQAQLPRRRPSARSTSSDWPRRCWSRAATRATGRCWPARCRSGAPAGVLRRARTPTARRSAAASPSTPARPRCRRSSTRCPAAAPDLMKPNGEELASFTGDDADAARVRPGRAPRRPPASLIERGVGAVLATLGGNGAVLVTAGRAPGTPRRPPPPSSAPSVPATPACSATCSATSGGCPPPSAWPWPSPTAAPPPACPAPPSPSRRSSARSSSASPTLWEAAHDRTDHHRPGHASGADWGSDKHDVIRALAARRRRRRPSRRPRTSSSRTPSPARRPPRPACPAASRSRTAARPGSRCRRWPSRDSTPRRRLRRQGRPGRPGVPDRRAGRRRRRPPARSSPSWPARWSSRRSPTRCAPPRADEDVVDLVAAELGEPAAAPAKAARSHGRRDGSLRGCGRRPPPAQGRHGAAGAVPASRRSSRSPRARPASPTPTWPPRPSRPPPSGPGSSCTSRPRARPAPRRSPHDTISRGRRGDLRRRRRRARPRPVRRQADGQLRA